ncbi:MAG: transketolase [Spirochaetaceae bacterium]|jgi:transketolase|nr:transketolase [Spirochaetaceae bacterium]
MNIEERADDIRKKFIRTAALVEATHVASSLSCIDIITALYFGGVLRYDPSDPLAESRDRFILSKGHAAVALYNALCEAGFFTREALHTYCKPGSIFGGLATSQAPGVEWTTGSLGHGPPLAVGTALSLRLKKSNSLVYLLTGDGECQEGSVWEAAASISRYNLTNLIWIIDNNKIQSTDRVDVVMGLEPLEEKLKSFGFETVSVDGHSCRELVSVLSVDRGCLPEKPLAVIANTIKGKGASAVENKTDSHSKMLSREEYSAAFKEFGVPEDETS